MKKILIFVSVSLMAIATSLAQNVLLEIKSGVSFSTTTLDRYSAMKQAPCKLMIGGGLKHLQVGVETILPLAPPSHIFNDPFIQDEKRVRETIIENYYGGFLRLNTARDPREDVGFLIKVGAGRFTAQKHIFALPSDLLYEERAYEPGFDFNAEAGLVIPIPKVFCLTIQYGFNHRDYKMRFQDVTLEDFRIRSHTVFLGIAIHI